MTARTFDPAANPELRRNLYAFLSSRCANLFLAPADVSRVTISAVQNAPDVPPLKPMRYVARQPIFDRDEKVYGYELLFRDGIENAFHGDSEIAARATLDNSLVMGVDVLCDGHRAFVNCTRDTLIKGLVRLLPAAPTVVEVLETVPPDPDVIAACVNLKEAGYMIALDDFVADDRREAPGENARNIKKGKRAATKKEGTGGMKKNSKPRWRGVGGKK